MALTTEAPIGPPIALTTAAPTGPPVALSTSWTTHRWSSATYPLCGGALLLWQGFSPPLLQCGQQWLRCLLLRFFPLCVASSAKELGVQLGHLTLWPIGKQINGGEEL